MDQIILTLPAISTVNLAFVWRVSPNSFAKPVATGTTLFPCVEVLQQLFYQPLERYWKRKVDKLMSLLYKETTYLSLSVSVQKCPVLNQTHISAGSINCSPPNAPYSYNSTCEVMCDEGYEASGQNQLRCDHTGRWSASVPACTSKDICYYFILKYV